MAQTTWSDLELRQTVLEGLTALTEDDRQRGHPFLTGVSIILGVALGIALL